MSVQNHLVEDIIQSPENWTLNSFIKFFNFIINSKKDKWRQVNNIKCPYVKCLDIYELKPTHDACM